MVPVLGGDVGGIMDDIAACWAVHVVRARFHMCLRMARAMGFSVSLTAMMSPLRFFQPVIRGWSSMVSNSGSSLASSAKVAGALMPLSSK